MDDPHVLRSEFVLWQLMKQGKLKMDDVAPCLATFDSLDTDGSGNLNQEDIDLFLKHQAEKHCAGKSSYQETARGTTTMAGSCSSSSSQQQAAQTDQPYITISLPPI